MTKARSNAHSVPRAGSATAADADPSCLCAELAPPAEPPRPPSLLNAICCCFVSASSEPEQETGGLGFSIVPGRGGSSKKADAFDEAKQGGAVKIMDSPMFEGEGQGQAMFDSDTTRSQDAAASADQDGTEAAVVEIDKARVFVGEESPKFSTIG